MIFLDKKLYRLNSQMSKLTIKCSMASGERELMALHSNQFSRKQTCLCDFLILAFFGFLILSHSLWVQAEQPSEYRLKVAFLYNFAAYTEWPSLPNHILCCIYGEDPFGKHLHHLRQKKVNEHEILIQHIENIEDLSHCQMVFIARSAAHNLSDIINKLNGMPILTIADTPGAGQQGIILNMSIKEEKVIFEANVASAKRNNLKLNAQLLRFATEVYQ